MAQTKVVPNSTVITIAPADSSSETLIVCLTQTGYTATNTAVDAASFCGVDTLPGATTFDLTFSGQRMINPDAGNISEYGLLQLVLDKTRVQWTIGPITPVTGDVVITGEGYLNTFSTDNSTDTVPTMTGTINADSSTVVVVETP
jgi:hypothetical protein